MKTQLKLILNIFVLGCFLISGIALIRSLFLKILKTLKKAHFKLLARGGMIICTSFRFRLEINLLRASQS